VIVLGIDLGTNRPSVAWVDVSERRPNATVQGQSFARTPKRVRAQVATAFIQGQLRDFAAYGWRHVFIEDPTATGFGKSERGVTNYRTTTLLTAQLHNLTGFAQNLGLEVEHITPRTIGSTLGFGRYPKTLAEYQRRKEKKARTKRWVEVNVDTLQRLTYDDADAITIACAGWFRSKARVK